MTLHLTGTIDRKNPICQHSEKIKIKTGRTKSADKLNKQWVKQMDDAIAFIDWLNG